ncbi:hypothetical protein Ethha_2477 [Ethanoligenens harbinense YUAN-3]|uniref:Uncharacterized protein n=1 Tax=Ethanoligenens harbinense (strain DSM 18485 / JCM 12961 / CGMCC 1.5033 / YUAN-3) TaxID=663278 RepID=E6U5V4_ETHHY|nr:hypothetical protein Ethha_2477 [Ethanoligenens harbinense YUAN-3]
MQAVYIIMIVLLFAAGAYGSALNAHRKSAQKPPEKESKRNVKKPQ